MGATYTFDPNNKSWTLVKNEKSIRENESVECDTVIRLHLSDLLAALEDTRPSIGRQDLEKYQKM